MRRVVLRLMTAIQLTRLTIAFGAVSDLWFVILLTRSDDDYVMVDVFHMPLVPALVAGAVVAVGLFAYGAALNDILDVRHDAAFSPERPIPAGRIKPVQAVVVTVGALIVAVLAAASMGTWAVCLALLTAAGILFYNTTGKYIPTVGVLTLGLVHVAHMFIPNHELSLTLPVWLVMTHVMVIAILARRWEDKRPRLSGRSLTATVIGWLIWSVLLIGAGVWSGGGLWPESAWPRLGWPLAAVVAFGLMAYFKTRRVTGRIAAEKLRRYGAMWQSLYGAAWLVALELRVEALWIGLFAIAGFTTMTVIKELTGLSGDPVTYRA